MLEILEPSPHRVEPKCPLFALCGGCQYQHMNIDLQREWKTRQVKDILERIGKFQFQDLEQNDHNSPKSQDNHVANPNILPNVLYASGTREQYGYRSKITPHYDAPLRNPSKEIDAIGFKQKTSRRLVDVTRCDIATEAINEALTKVREDKFLEAREGRLKRPKKGATLLLRDAHQYAPHKSSLEQNTNPEPVVETDHNTYVQTSVKDITFRFLAGNFFQNNPFVLPIMVDHVVGASIRPNVDGEKMTHLIDCYCGSGLFCLTSAKEFQLCVGIEVNDKAVEEAKFNAQLNGVQNCKFVAASAEAIFESDDPIEIAGHAVEQGDDENDNMNEETPCQQLQQQHNSQREQSSLFVRDFPKDRTVVVVDPPRKGCSAEFLDQLYRFRPQRIVYMSCDPATQARDARGIVDAGYEVTSIQPFDLFPQTRHIENLMVFEKRS